MVNGKKVTVVLPAYNAALTLEQTIADIPLDVVDDIILTDDGSSDGTLALANRLKIKHVLAHHTNLGYGANQKTCYRKALEVDSDIVVMLHPDYQYTPKLIPAMVHLIANDIYPVVLGSRILGNGALLGGMPVYKYVANRLLTFLQNLATGAKLSEYHTGYRAFSAEVIRKVNFESNSDNFVFDNEMLSQIILSGYPIAEVTCPTKYFKEASSISFGRSIVYGMGVLRVSFMHWLQRMKLARFRMYESR